MGFLATPRNALPAAAPPQAARKGFGAFPSTGFLPALGSLPTASGVLVNQATALNVSAVYSCVRIRSRDLARCEPQVLRDDGAGTKTRITDHPLAKLFQKPNSAQTWFEFIEQLGVGYLLRGNAYAVILRDWRGTPIELIPINPDYVTVFESQDGSIFYQIMAVGLWLMAKLQGEPALIPAADVFHLRDVSFNALVGLSRIGAARDAIGLAMVQEQMAARSAAQGARPSGVLTTAKRLNDDGAARLKTQWDQLQSGLQNTGRTPVLEDGVEWKPFTLTTVDAEFNPSRLTQVKEIARFFEVPLHKLGENEDLPRASIDQLNADYVQGVVMGDATRWEQKLVDTFGLVALGFEVKLDERGLPRSDLGTMINTARTGVMSGLVTQNEGRAYIGYGPMPGADRLLAPVNLAPNGSAADGVAPDGAGRPRAGDLPGAAKGAGALTDVIAEAVAKALKTFHADQPRDEHGRWTSGDSGADVPATVGAEKPDGGGGEHGHAEPSDLGAESARLWRLNAKMVVAGAVAIAAGALVAAMVPETATAVFAVQLATKVSNGMFTTAGLSSAEFLLKAMGVPIDRVTRILDAFKPHFLTVPVQPTVAKGLTDSPASVLKAAAPTDAEIAETLRTALAEVTDMAHDGLVEKLKADHADASHLDAVVAAIGAARDAFKAKLAGFTIGDAPAPATTGGKSQPLPFDDPAESPADPDWLTDPDHDPGEDWVWVPYDADDLGPQDKYNPDQPRDARGRWVRIGSAEHLAAIEAAKTGNRIPKKKAGFKHYVVHEQSNETKLFADEAKIQAASLGGKTISDQEKGALKDYTGNGYAELNKNLRAGGAEKKAAEETAFARNLDSAISKSKLPESTVLFRGIAKHALSQNPNILKTGSVITDDGFISTSLKRSVADDFNKGSGVTVKLYAYKGAYALPLNGGKPETGKNLSGLPIEHEVLLPRSTSYRILNVETNGKKKTVHAELL